MTLFFARFRNIARLKFVFNLTHTHISPKARFALQGEGKQPKPGPNGPKSKPTQPARNAGWVIGWSYTGRGNGLMKLEPEGPEPDPVLYIKNHETAYYQFAESHPGPS